MTRVADAEQRARALDPQQSFCVTAPAGSGKTELLIQRFLRLLARVQRPEQVLAITFTRKAAAEMRERVHNALVEASAGNPVVSEHQALTRRLALDALDTAAHQGWELLRDLNQFNIKTIDSFCAGLTAQMPVLSQLGGSLRVEDDARPLYREAVELLFDGIEDSGGYTEDLSALMLHFSNDWDRLATLLADLLARREQWRAYVGVHYEPAQSERYLVATVESIVEDALTTLAEQLAPYEAQLLQLLQYSALHLGDEVPGRFPDCQVSGLDHWRALTGLLLTQKGEWRKQVNAKQGFPASGDNIQEHKALLQSLLEELRQIPGLETQLGQVLTLPTMRLGSPDWDMVLRLSRLLPMLAAQLLLVFRKHGVVDHAQVAQSALLALGEPDDPTDLALRLDYRIEHILVDEFQDTAVTQYDLLMRLTGGWGEHNVTAAESPRTLFIVGDGMQSIYGFRGANVGLLLKAQREGFNGVMLESLVLRSNFRSQANIVQWVNDTFSRAFPGRSNPNLAQVAYTPATAVRPASLDPAVTLQFFSGEHSLQDELRFVCERIAALQTQDGASSIAVLGRSRNQLAPLLEAMKQRGLSYHAQDLDSLERSPTVADLLVLCRTLANPADRLAWMSLLRSPCCGLSLTDLLALARAGAEASQAGLWAVSNAALAAGQLSEESSARLARVIEALQFGQAARDRLALRVWIEQVWLMLDGPAAAASQHALTDVLSFMELLEEADAQGLGLDVEWLEEQLARRYMSGGDVDCQVQVMTIHKAKGLEFGHVIIPQMARSTRGDGRDLLLWDEYSDLAGNRGFLMAGDDREKKSPTLYNYLATRRKAKSQQENARLMYVGATRAIETLTLTGCVALDPATEEPRAPAANSLLHTVWPALADSLDVRESLEGDVEPAGVAERPLQRLVLAPVTLRAYSSETPAQNLPEPPTHHLERVVGTVIHMALEHLSYRAELPGDIEEAERVTWRSALREHGLVGVELDEALQRVERAVSNVLAKDGEGRWLLSPEHPVAASEWPITLVEDGALVQCIVDRTFVDSTTDVRWIVDYKSGVPLAGESVDQFKRREADTYRQQLRRYRDAVQALESRAIRCALYFTGLGELHALPELDVDRRA